VYSIGVTHQKKAYILFVYLAEVETIEDSTNYGYTLGSPER
jgi:hypothetical protein